MPRPDLSNILSAAQLPAGPVFYGLQSQLFMPETIFGERFGKINGVVLIPSGADFSGVAQKMVLPRPVSFEQAGTKIAAPTRLTPLNFEGISGQARIKVMFPGGAQVLPNYGLGIPLGAEKPLLEPKIKKDEKTQ
ncbi:MAG: hypothetical protein NT088_00300 [Candidatus Omnitrophica bacterium]|nr:hypothetical protein [Candidatus Omnitrophota bacterium]